MKKKYSQNALIISILFFCIIACSSSDNNDTPPEERVLTTLLINSSNGNQLCEGEDTILSVSGLDQFNDPIDITEPINWSSNNISVNVDQEGNVVAQFEGTAVITASVSGIQRDLTINVLNGISSVTINIGTRKYLVGLDDSFSANINITTCDGIGDSSVVWESSDETKILIDDNGLLTSVDFGTSTIKAIVGGIESNPISIEVFPSVGNGPKEMLEDIIDFMKSWDLPGASLGIVKDEKLIYLNGLGYQNTETKEPVENNSLFRIASISKPITSAAIFKLIENGQLSLDDNVFGTTGILNQAIFTNNFPDSRLLNITVRDILYHQGGWDLAIQGDPMFNTVQIANSLGVPNPATTENIVDYITQSYTLDFNPGTSFKYSNYGYCVLGRVIEKISGMTYENYVKTNVLNLAGATNTILGKNLLEDKHPDEVIYYEENNATATSVYGTGQQVPWQYGGFNIEAMDAHGGWISNAKELLKFMTVVDGNGYRTDILSSSSLNQIHTPSPNFSSYSMGWEQIGNNWFHTGSVPGSSSLLYNGSNGESFAIIFNSWPFTQQGQFYNDLRPFMLSRLNAISEWSTIDLFD